MIYLIIAAVVFVLLIVIASRSNTPRTDDSFDPPYTQPPRPRKPGMIIILSTPTCTGMTNETSATSATRRPGERRRDISEPKSLTRIFSKIVHFRAVKKRKRTP